MRRLTPLLSGLLLLALVSAAQAQSNIRVVTSCGSQSYTPQDGTAQFMTMDTTGKLCTSGSSSGGSSASTFGGTPVAPDASTVVTGGTAVTALAAGHATGGGQIWNPTGAAGPLCISLVGAAGTSEGGGTTCIPPGLNFTIAAQSGAVSVNATDSGHVFAGTGYIGTGTITYTPYAPDASTVTTGGTAVTAFAAGDVIGGGYLNNPSTAAAPLCVALVGAAGTASGGATQCIPAGQPFYIAPQTGAVSVNATDSGHLFSGTGYH